MTPKLFVFEHGISHQNKLAHAGNDGHFEQFALGFQVLVEAFEDGGHWMDDSIAMNMTVLIR